MKKSSKKAVAIIVAICAVAVIIGGFFIAKAIVEAPKIVGNFTVTGFKDKTESDNYTVTTEHYDCINEKVTKAAAIEILSERFPQNFKPSLFNWRKYEMYCDDTTGYWKVDISQLSKTDDSFTFHVIIGREDNHATIWASRDKIKKKAN